MSTANETSVTVTFDPNAINKQSDVIGAAAPGKAGVMTAAQVAALDGQTGSIAQLTTQVAAQGAEVTALTQEVTALSGQVAVAGRLPPSIVVDASSSPFSAQPNQVTRVDPSIGVIAVNLPPALGNSGAWVIVKIVTAGINPVSIFPAGADTIDDLLSTTLVGAFAVLRLISDGASNWMVV
jgi:hypothetical protein